MKTIFKIAVILCLAAALCGCYDYFKNDEGEKLPACDHEWARGVHYDPTCTSTGWGFYVCNKCRLAQNWAFEIPIDPAKHSFQTTRLLSPTCYALGKERKNCIRYQEEGCNAPVDEYDLPKIGHAFSLLLSEVEPTCTSDGKRISACEFKDEGCEEPDLRKEEKLYAYGHLRQTIIDVSPTCTDTGKGKERCVRSGCDDRGEKEVVIPAAGHSFSVVRVVAPTCLTPGTGRESCSRCGVTGAQLITIAALGHDWYKTSGIGYQCHRCLAYSLTPP